MNFKVKDLYANYGKELSLELLAGKEGVKKNIRKPEVHRPGLSLSGYYRNLTYRRLLIFGKSELDYLKELDRETRCSRLDSIITEKIPAVIVARKLKPIKELSAICEKKNVALFRSDHPTMALMSHLLFVLSEQLAPTVTVHGTLVEVFGVGVLIQGESSIGKSEAALGLLEKGHRLISDDAVELKKKEGKTLIGSGPNLTRHLIEIRGIGILNVAHLYGAICVLKDKKIDVVIQLEEWDPNHFYDRVGLGERFTELLDVQIPFHLLPVKPGRDVILLIETIALQHRLKEMGYNSAKEFNVKLLEAIQAKQKKRNFREDYTKIETEK